MLMAHVAHLDRRGPDVHEVSLVPLGLQRSLQGPKWQVQATVATARATRSQGCRCRQVHAVPATKHGALSEGKARPLRRL